MGSCGLCAVILLAAAAVATDFDRCGSGAPPRKLEVEGCRSQPCVLKASEEVVVNVYFAVDHEVTKLTPEVAAESNGVPVDFTLPDKDGCKYLLGSCCPVKANQTVRYHLHVNTPPVLVQNVTLTFTMKDQDAKNLVCFKVKATE